MTLSQTVHKDKKSPPKTPPPPRKSTRKKPFPPKSASERSSPPSSSASLINKHLSEQLSTLLQTQQNQQNVIHKLQLSAATRAATKQPQLQSLPCEQKNAAALKKKRRKRRATKKLKQEN